MKKNIEILNKLKEEFDYDNYESFLSNVEKVYGKLYVFIVLITDYIYAVKDGGHGLYFTDNFAGENDIPYVADEVDLRYYDKLMELIEELDIEKELQCFGFYELLSKFNVKIDDREMIEVDCRTNCFEIDVEEKEDGYEICHICGGTGIEEIDNPEYAEIKNPEYLDKLDLVVKPKINMFVKKLNKFIIRSLA